MRIVVVQMRMQIKEEDRDFKGADFYGTNIPLDSRGQPTYSYDCQEGLLLKF